MKPVNNIDVYASESPKSNGYKIYAENFQSANFSLCRLEDLNRDISMKTGLDGNIWMLNGVI